MLTLAAPPAQSGDFTDMTMLKNEALSITFSPDGGSVYIGDGDGNVRRWNLSTGDVSLSVRRAFSDPTETSTILNLVRVTPDGTHALIAYGSGEIRFVDLTSGKDVWKAKFFSKFLKSMAMSPDGKLGVTSASDGQRVVLFSTVDGKVIWDVKHAMYVDDLAFSASGDLILQSEDNTLKAETLDGQMASFDFDLPGLTSFHDIEVAANGVVAAAAYGEVHLYNGKSGKRLRVVKIDGDLNGKIVTISGDGKRFVTQVMNGQAGLFDAKSGKMIGAFGAKGKLVKLTALAFSPDGSRIIVGDNDGQISLWKAQGLKQIATVRFWASGYVVVLPDGAFMIEPGNEKPILDFYDIDLSKAEPDKVKAALAK